jgi:hypothetical protein
LVLEQINPGLHWLSSMQELPGPPTQVPFMQFAAGPQGEPQTPQLF